MVVFIYKIKTCQINPFLLLLQRYHQPFPQGKTPLEQKHPQMERIFLTEDLNLKLQDVEPNNDNKSYIKTPIKPT